MGTIIIGALVTAFISAIGGRIAMWRLRVYLTENKDAIKWQVIYTIFGPPPNAPVAPTPEPQRPFLDWWRNRRNVHSAPWDYSPRRVAESLSWAERYVGLSGCFLVCLAMSLVGFVVYMMVMLTRWN